MSVQPDYLLGIHEFKARSEDELDIEKGDYVEVIEDDAEFEDSWYTGRNLRTGLIGLFPKVFTTSIPGRPPAIGAEHSVSGNATGLAHTFEETSGKSSPAVSDEALPRAVSAKPSSAPQNGRATASTGPSYRPITKAAPGVPLEPPKPDMSLDTSVGSLGANGSPLATATTAGGVNSAISARSNSTAHPSLHKTMSDIDEALSEIAAATAPNMATIGYWTPQEVRSYFLSRGYDAQTAEKFVQHQITGNILLELDLNFLKEIDIASFGTRFEISKDIKQLNQYVEQSGQGLPGPDAQVVGGPRTPNLSDTPLPAAVSGSAASQRTQPYALSSPAPVENRWDSPAPSQRNQSEVQRQMSHQSEQPLAPIDPGRSQASVAFENSQRPPQSQQRGLADSALAHTPELGEQGKDDWSGKRRPELGGHLNTADSTPTSFQPRDHDQDHGLEISTPATESASSEDAGSSFYKNTKHTRSVSDIAFPTGDLTHLGLQTSGQRSASQPGAQQSHHRRHSSIVSVLPEPTASPAAGSTTPKQASTPKRQGTFKGLRSASSQYLRPTMVKQKTSAFIEGIKQVTAEESAKTSEHSGWMQKRGGIGVGTWKSRYFTLHGTRLSYFTNFKDSKERGLIDITGHRVVIAKENEDKLISLYAVGVGAGRYCFKLVPPGPGYKKGVSFTAPKVHYFAVETVKELRAWMGALMKATIERDDSQPVVSSCTTPTVSLPRAREIVAERLANQSDSEDNEPSGRSVRSIVDVVYKEQQNQAV